MKGEKAMEKNNDVAKILLTAKETSQALGCGLMKAYELMKKDSFPKVYNGTRAMTIASELDDWVKAHKGGQI